MFYRPRHSLLPVTVQRNHSRWYQDHQGALISPFLFPDRVLVSFSPPERLSWYHLLMKTIPNPNEQTQHDAG